jgi:hypothetical protein
MISLKPKKGVLTPENVPVDTVVDELLMPCLDLGQKVEALVGEMQKTVREAMEDKMVEAAEQIFEWTEIFLWNKGDAKNPKPVIEGSYGDYHGLFQIPFKDLLDALDLRYDPEVDRAMLVAMRDMINAKLEAAPAKGEQT